MGRQSSCSLREMPEAMRGQGPEPVLFWCDMGPDGTWTSKRKLFSAPTSPECVPRMGTRAQVVRAALRTLKERIEQERLRSEIRESVKRCAEADRRENRLLAPGGVARHE